MSNEPDTAPIEAPAPSHAPADRIEALEAKLETLASEHAGLRGQLFDLADKVDAAAKAGGGADHAGLVQEVIDFLHWAFPRSSAGRLVPGKPSDHTDA